jgi:hypothetical protein
MNFLPETKLRLIERIVKPEESLRDQLDAAQANQPEFFYPERIPNELGFLGPESDEMPVSR